MSDTFTPSDTLIRNGYLYVDREPGEPREVLRERSHEFDRWLAAHDRAVQARALDDAADALYADERAGGPLWHSLSVRTWLLDRAARLTATTEEPTTPVHVGGRVNAEDCPACSPVIDPPPYPWICPGPNTTGEPTRG